MSASKYRRIAETLTSEYAALPPGSKVDGEHAIAARFGVGRAAARAALQELERQLLVRRVRGRGTYTSRRVDYVISAAQAPSWSKTLREAGAKPRTVVRSCEVVPMPAFVAEALSAQEAQPCHLLYRRSFIDDLPASWGAEWVPLALVPELATAVRVEESLDRIVRDTARIEPVRGWVRASMETATEAVAVELGVNAGSLVWFVESMNQDRMTGSPAYLTQRWIRADAVRTIFHSGEAPGT